MRGLVGALLLCACVGATHTRSRAWRSNEALFLSAVRVAPDLPRPALNYGVALLRAGRVEDGLGWTIRAAELADAQQDRTRRAEAVAALQWFHIRAGLPCYDGPSRSWCVWLSP